MSNIYRARFDGVKFGFHMLVKADSIAQARAGVMKHVVSVDRATDSEIFEAARSGEVLIDLTSENPTDAAQQPLPMDGGEAKAVTQPAWLAQELSRGEPVAQDTGD